MQESIVAIATPSGIGGICIVRLSGSTALAIASAITHKPTLTPRHATLSLLYDVDNNVLDEAIVLYFKAPHSYTREDVIEFQCHGGDIIGQDVLQACLALGARIARPGEFTKRAVLNGRLDIAQANALAHMISTQDVAFQRALLRQLRGALGEFVSIMRDKLLNALAHTEVMIDYSEEDLPTDIINNIATTLASIQKELEHIYSFSCARHAEGINLAIIGKPNVGKSSLLNAILLYERAITSNTPGTTRDRIEEWLRIGTHRVRIIDTAGIRTSNDPLESKGIEKSLEALKECHIALAVFDGSRALNADDMHIINLIQAEKHARDIALLAILNKADLPLKLDASLLHQQLALDTAPLAIHALDTAKAANSIYEALSLILKAQSTPSIILSAPYQIEALRLTKAHLSLAQEKLSSTELELFACHIKDALNALGTITHPYHSEEMLEHMFSQFCLGK